MSTGRALEFVSVDDYLSGEEQSPVKREYIGGMVYAMVGARNVHNIIASNVLGSLFGQLDGRPCRVFNSDTKIRIRMSSQTRFYYPDASVICQPNPQSDVFQDQPAVIVEVLSDSTRRIDDGEKREAYLTIPSLTHYVLLEQDFPGAIIYERTDSGFERQVFSKITDNIAVPELNATIALAAVYDGVDFSAE